MLLGKTGITQIIEVMQVITSAVVYMSCEHSAIDLILDSLVSVWNAMKELEFSAGLAKIGLPQEKDLSFFEDTPSFSARRLDDIESVSIALQKVINGEPLGMKVVSSRYGHGLCLMERGNVVQLSETLRRYLSALKEI